MHPPLGRPHPDCQEEIQALLRCHEENPMGKFFGLCTDVKVAMDKCFKREKLAKAQKNLQQARESDRKFRQKVQEYHARQQAKQQQQRQQEQQDQKDKA